MPYDVRRSGSQYEVVVADTGRVVGKHPTRAAAERQQAALYANVPEASKAEDSIDAIDNNETINRRRQLISGSKNKKPKKDEQPIQNNWNGMFFPRRG